MNFVHYKERNEICFRCNHYLYNYVVSALRHVVCIASKVIRVGFCSGRKRRFGDAADEQEAWIKP